MADPRTIIEGSLKYRDGRKWKPRWCVVSKLSPVADCLHLQLYRDSKDCCKNVPTKASLSLKGFLGMETSFTLDKESNTMALICSEVVIMLAFDSRELLIQWQVKVRANLVEEQQFLVQIAHVPPRSKLSSGPARLHLQDFAFCLVSGIPPRLLGEWLLPDLRRFGVVDGKFCFEGGSKCGKGEGLHILHTNQSQELARAFELASKGKLHVKRKMAARKNSALTSSPRMSMQPKLADDFDLGSCESRRPLLSSGSEGSETCPLSAHTTPGGQEMSTSKCTSKVRLRWPSMPCGGTFHGNVPGTDPEHIGRCCEHHFASATLLSGNAGNIPQRIFPEIQNSWLFCRSNHCGRSFCGTDTIPLRGNQCMLSPEAMELALGFNSQWTLELRDRLAPTRNCSLQHRKKPVADRDSLCSDSSHSSGTSTGSGSSSSSSDYSLPRNYLESLYDRPRNIHHIVHQTVPMQAIRSGRTMICHFCDQVTEVSEDEKFEDEFCTCQEAAKYLAGKSTNDHGVVVKCALCKRTSNFRKMSVVSATSSRSDSSNESPSSSPKKGSVLPSDSGTMPVIRGSVPCSSAQQEANPYAHYAVPRSALSELHFKEKSTSGSDSKTPNDPENVNNENQPPSDLYDVPRKFQELHLTPTDIQTSSDSKNRQETVVPHGTPFMDQPKICPCQRVMLWAGSVASTYADADHNLQSKVKSVKCTCGEKMSRAGDSQCCLHLPIGPCCCAPLGNRNVQAKVHPSHSTNEQETANKEKKVDYVNLQFEKQDAAALDNDAVKSAVPDYANLQFVQSLCLYENATCLTGQPGPNGNINLDDGTRNMTPSSASCMSISSSASSQGGGDIKQMDKKPSNSSISGSSYEVMNFCSHDSSTADDGNYLYMQPLCSNSSLNNLFVPDNSDRDSNCDQSPDNPYQVRSAEDSVLPLRPFMPYTLPCHGSRKKYMADSSPEQDEDGRNVSSPTSPSSKHQDAQNYQNKAGRSNSLNDLKRKVFFYSKPSSGEGKSSGKSANYSDPEISPLSPTGSLQRMPKRGKKSLFNMFSLHAKDKSFSTDDITPPSSASTTPNSLSFEHLRRASFHRSADCLKVKEDYRSSDEDVYQSCKNSPPSTPNFSDEYRKINIACGASHRRPSKDNLQMFAKQTSLETDNQCPLPQDPSKANQCCSGTCLASDTNPPSNANVSRHREDKGDEGYS